MPSTATLTILSIKRLQQWDAKYRKGSFLSIFCMIRGVEANDLYSPVIKPTHIYTAILALDIKMRNFVKAAFFLTVTTLFASGFATAQQVKRADYDVANYVMDVTLSP